MFKNSYLYSLVVVFEEMKVAPKIGKGRILQMEKKSSVPGTDSTSEYLVPFSNRLARSGGPGLDLLCRVAHKQLTLCQLCRCCFQNQSDIQYCIAKIMISFRIHE
jgi:hypothetical protein